MKTTILLPLPSIDHRLITGLFIVGLVLLLPTVANAAGAGGTMPWDANFLKIIQSFTGPTAYGVTILMAVAGACTFAFGHHEASGFIKLIAFVVLLGSFLMGSTAFANAMGWTGALV